MITLVKDTIDKSDIDRLIEWLKTYPRLTKGEVTLQLEEKFSKWLGRKYSVFVNSGSSANLLMLSALQQGDYLKNNKVVVPSTSWATDLAPVIQLGMEPLLCDSNLKDLSVDLLHLEEIFKEFASLYFPDFKYLQVQMNYNFKAPPHHDSKNIGESVLCCFGDYTGGLTVVEYDDKTVAYDAREQPIKFNGSKYKHYVTPFTNDRYSLVFFNNINKELVLRDEKFNLS